MAVLLLSLTALPGCKGGQTDNAPASKANSSPQMPASNPKNPRQHPATSKILGEWVVIADTSGQGHTGHLFLNNDGSFKGDYESKESKDTFSGRFTVSDEQIANENFISLKLTMLRYNNVPAPAPGPLRLLYDSARNILHDFMTVAYSRPGEQEQAKKYYYRPVPRGVRVEEPVLQSRLVWKVELPGRDKGFFGLTTGQITEGADSEVIVADEAGFKVFDSSGRQIRFAKLDTQPGRLLALGQLDTKAVVVQFDRWGNDVTAYEPDGKPVWNFVAGRSGIDWLSSVRLDSRNTGYVIGYNGGGGVELLGPDGKSRWLAKADWNVWGVTGLKPGRKSPELAIGVGPDGDAIAFDLSGKRAKRFKTGDIGAVGAVDLDGDGIEELLTLGTTIVSGLKLSIFDADGNLKWSKKASATEAAFLDGEPFLFGSFGPVGHLLGVVDNGGILFFKPDGVVFGTFKSDKAISSAAILHRSARSDLLVLRLPNELQCYELGGK